MTSTTKPLPDFRLPYFPRTPTQQELDEEKKRQEEAVSQETPPEPKAERKIIVVEPVPLKGEAKRVFSNQQLNQLSDKTVDFRDYNAAYVEIIVRGTTPSATFTIEGGEEEGGNFFTLPDSAATQSGVNANKVFTCIVPSRFIKVRMASVSGTYASGEGFTVTITPYRS